SSVSNSLVLSSTPCFFSLSTPMSTELYTLSLHDALPILYVSVDRQVPADAFLSCWDGASEQTLDAALARPARRCIEAPDAPRQRSEEHTSELQSQSNLVCRLLLEKKKNKVTCV